ncbi:MAG: hypothetical protein V3U27_21320, partial [Candidatus Tectomicrobia bacterium]
MLDRVAQCSALKALGELCILFLVHPLRAGGRCEPLHPLIVLTELFHPARAWLAFLPRAAPGARLHMGASWGEVDDVFLMHADHGMHAAPHEQREMDRGTQAPIGHQDVTGSQVRMEPDDLGEIRRTQGGRQYFQDHTGAGMQQRHAMGNGKTAPRLLAPGLATMLVELGGIGHGKTRAIGPKGAIAQPASFLEGLVVHVVTHPPEKPLEDREREFH